MNSRCRPAVIARAAGSGFVVALLALAACTGDDGDPGEPGKDAPVPLTDADLAPDEDPPGVVITITSVAGGSGPAGAFRVGDRPSITFRITKDDGSDWKVEEMASLRTLMSGPTSNYQRVLAEVSDVAAMATLNKDGTYTYRYAAGIPATYLAPINDSASFDADDGELAGQPLLDGTYTIGLYGYWQYTVEGDSFRDISNATVDVLFGAAPALEPRELVTQDNCNACHTRLQAHGGQRQDVTLCLLCHTAGAEDRNTASVENGTPGVSIDFRVMIHKIHDGEHLPSVLGIATNPDGSRNYGATPHPYKILGRNDSVNDFSEVAFPVWPNLNIAMPRDGGYTALTSGQKAQEDATRTGVTACAKCHGDPDGSGPAAPPAQGAIAFTQPSRNACGSCHDDVDWDAPYTANAQTMPAQATDTACTLCHEASGSLLDVEDAHRHPLKDPAVNPGLNVGVSSLVEAGTNDGDGTIDPGEKIELTLDLTDDAGGAVSPAAFASISAVLAGPTSNSNVLLNGSIPTAILTGGAPYTIRLPQVVPLEFAGDATNDGAIETFATARTPHLNVTGALTAVFERTATAGGDTTLASAVPVLRNYVDVASAAGFARDEYVVLEDGVVGGEEYLRIQYVDGTRLWFGSSASTSYAPGVRIAHAAGATVREVTLTAQAAGVDFTVNAATGEISEVAANSFAAGNAVVATYTSDFVMPSVHPLAINDSPDLDVSSGEWAGLPIESGTYTLSLWAAIDRVVALWGETQTYRGTSPDSTHDFLVGDATAIAPYELITSANNCYACHDDLYLHGGGRRGFGTCIACHGTVGAEDRPRYVAGNAPATTGTSISFREMLHKIHMGAELTNASTYEVVGFGSTAWPNNYGVNAYSHVHFPSLPSGAKACAKCHGDDSTAWMEPSAREHSLGQSEPTRTWRVVCAACHDSSAAIAHIDVNTSASGAEACAICHDPDGAQSVELVHKIR